MIVVMEHTSTVRNRTGKVGFARAMPTTNPRTGMPWERDWEQIVSTSSPGSSLVWHTTRDEDPGEIGSNLQPDWSTFIIAFSNSRI